MKNLKEPITSVLDLIGNTPIMNLEELVGCPCFCKLEFLNPGGSIKDRIAYAMIQDAIENGQLKPGMGIIEPTSGNTGIALSLIGRVLGYPVTIVMPENMSIERQKMIQVFGAKLILTDSKLSIDGSVQRAQELYQNGLYYMPMQFKNPTNAKAQMETAKEALIQMNQPADIFISGIGSGGTLQGMATVLLEANPHCKIIAIEPKGVSSLKGDPPGIHAIQGIGDGFIPDILDTSLIDEIIEVSDEEAIQTCQLLAKKFGLFVGVSSGANIYGAMQVAKKYGQQQTILTVLADRGERYFSANVFVPD